MMDLAPAVSIILPTYNRAQVIGQTIQSVIDQTFKDWELIVIDDGSEDNTREVLEQVGDRRLHYLAVPHSGHIGKVRNAGIQNSRGQYIAFLDSDDLWRNDKLEIQLALLNQFPDTAFVFSNGDQFGTGAIRPPDLDELFVGDVFLPQLVHNRFCLYLPSLIFRKSVIDVIGLMDEDAPTSSDIHYFYHLSYQFDGVFTNERLVKIRKHETNTSTKSGDAPYLNSLNMLLEFKRKKMISTSQFTLLARQCYYKMALQQLHRGQPREAVANFFNYIKLHPFHWKGWVRLVQGSLWQLKKGGF